MSDGAGNPAHDAQPPRHFAEGVYGEHCSGHALGADEAVPAAYMQHVNVADTGYLTHEALAYMHAHQDTFQVRGSLVWHLGACARQGENGIYLH